MSRNDRGSVSLEMVLLTPVLLCLLLLVVVGGRLANARNDVDFAAKAGARAASLSRSPAAANQKAQQAVQANLDKSSMKCSALSVTVDTANFRPGGQVTTVVNCAVDLSAASLLKIPASKSIEATFTEPIDQYIGSAT
jgi:Flp pilus assembly protein TadG